MTTGFLLNEYETKYWIVLKVPETTYEEGALHLLIIQGINTARLHDPEVSLHDPFLSTRDALALCDVVAAHWNLPQEN
jgi:hypothetical protein